MKRLFCCLIFTVLLSGCMGSTMYRVTTPDGVEIEVRNTKDYETYSLSASKSVDGTWNISLDETGVSASDPAQIMAGSMDKMSDSVNTLVKLLPAQ